MKKFMFAAVIAFWSSVFTFWAVANLASHAPTDREGEPRSITLKELATHDTEKDCWMAIEGKVYDFTDYIPKHPTAPAVIARWCGKEATEAYNTKGYGRPHSSAADASKPQYFIGVLAKN